MARNPHANTFTKMHDLCPENNLECFDLRASGFFAIQAAILVKLKPSQKASVTLIVFFWRLGGGEVVVVEVTK